MSDIKCTGGIMAYVDSHGIHEYKPLTVEDFDEYARSMIEVNCSPYLLAEIRQTLFPENILTPMYFEDPMPDVGT